MASRGQELGTPGARGTSASPGFGLTDIALLAMALIWGVNYSVVKFATEVMPPLAFNGFRVCLAAAALLLIARGPRPARRTLVTLVLLGALGNGIYQVLFVEGVARTRAGDAALIASASPAFMAIIGRLRGTERIVGRGVAGILLSLAGMCFVVWGSGAGGEHVAGVSQRAALFGDVLILAGALAWAWYTVLLRPYTHTVDGLQLSAWTMVGGAMVLIVAGASDMMHTSWSTLPALAWGSVLYSGFGALVLAYLFWYRGVRVLGPTRAAMYGNLQPVIAILVAWLMLGETPTLWQGVGTAAITGGLLLTRA